MNMSGKKKRLEKFLGETVRVRFKAPSGRTLILPEDTLVYKEGRKDLKEGFYLNEQGYRLLLSQFAGTYTVSTSHGECSVLVFELGKKVMEPLSHELIKNMYYLNN